MKRKTYKIFFYDIIKVFILFPVIIFGQTNLYRSVGITATDLNITNLTLQISSDTAIFSGNLPDNVGIGDIIQFENLSSYYVAVINKRISATKCLVTNTAGGTPNSTNAGTSFNIFRAYTSLYNWEVLNENDNLNDLVENFDTSTDLVAGNSIMNVICFADGIDTTPVIIDGWNTSSIYYLNIFTPTTSTEVGISQRHLGKWGSGFVLQTTNSACLTISDDNVRICGLQLYINGTNSFDQSNIFVTSTSGICDIRISQNILKGPGNSTSDWCSGIEFYNASNGTARIWNNIIYNWKSSTNDNGIDLTSESDFTYYVYNNTVYGISGTGFRLTGTTHLKNNIAQDCGDGYLIVPADEDYNISDLNELELQGTNDKELTSVQFVNSSGEDFRISSSDLTAKDAGVDLSGDLYLSFSDDINNTPRSAAWDIGADEYDVPLPVELNSFTGKVETNKIILKWITETEINNFGFEIIHNTNNEEFGWEKIGFVEGHGNSNSPKYYQFKYKFNQFGKHYFRLNQIDNDGTTEHSDIIFVEVAQIQDYAVLDQNYPNPFNPSTEILYQIADVGFVSLKIYDILGKEVATLVNEEKPAGSYEIIFYGTNLRSGIYFYQLRVGNYTETKKMLLLK